MNLRNRLLATLRGKPSDRVPLMLDGFAYDRREDIDALADSAEREIAHRAFNHCASFVGHPSYINRYLVTPPQYIKEVHRNENNGEVTTITEIATPRRTLTAVTKRNALTKTVWTVKYPVESMADIEAIRSVPWELPEGLAPPDAPKLPPTLAERGVLQTHVSSPFVCVAGMMPYDYFLELCATELALLRELSAQCKDRILDVLDVLLDGGLIDYVWMGGCEWVTPPMASLRVYEELVQDFEAELISRFHRAGALCHVHCHGNVRSTLEAVIRRGADFFEPVEPPPDGDITFAEAKALAAGRLTLGGNIEARLLANGDPSAVERATRQAFEGGKTRMVLKTSAESIGDVTRPMLENYHRMIDVWEELSPFP